MRHWALATLITVGCALVLLGACDLPTTPQFSEQWRREQREAQDWVKAGYYVWDDRTNLCFLVTTSGLGDTRVLAYTMVPCNDKVRAQIAPSAEAPHGR